MSNLPGPEARIVNAVLARLFLGIEETNGCLDHAGIDAVRHEPKVDHRVRPNARNDGRTCVIAVVPVRIDTHEHDPALAGFHRIPLTPALNHAPTARVPELSTNTEFVADPVRVVVVSVCPVAVELTVVLIAWLTRVVIILFDRFPSLRHVIAQSLRDDAGATPLVACLEQRRDWSAQSR